MWERFTIKKAWARSILEDAETCEAIWNGRQVATRDAKEEFELLRHSNDCFESVLMRQAYTHLLA